MLYLVLKSVSYKHLDVYKRQILWIVKIKFYAFCSLYLRTPLSYHQKKGKSMSACCLLYTSVGTGNAVGRAQHTEFKFIPSKRKRRRAVAVRRIPVKFGKNIDPQLHLCLFCSRIRRTGVDGLQDPIPVSYTHLLTYV